MVKKRCSSCYNFCLYVEGNSVASDLGYGAYHKICASFVIYYKKVTVLNIGSEYGCG